MINSTSKEKYKSIFSINNSSCIDSLRNLCEKIYFSGSIKNLSNWLVRLNDFISVIDVSLLGQCSFMYSRILPIIYLNFYSSLIWNNLFWLPNTFHNNSASSGVQRVAFNDELVFIEYIGNFILWNHRVTFCYFKMFHHHQTNVSFTRVLFILSR